MVPCPPCHVYSALSTLPCPLCPFNSALSDSSRNGLLHSSLYTLLSGIYHNVLALPTLGGDIWGPLLQLRQPTGADILAMRVLRHCHNVYCRLRRC